MSKIVKVSFDKMYFFLVYHVYLRMLLQMCTAFVVEGERDVDDGGEN